MDNFQSRRDKGIRLYADQLGMTAQEVEEHFIGHYGEEFSEAAFQATGGSAWEDNHLNLRDRSLLTIVILASVGGVDTRLEGHFRWALKHGATLDEIRSSLLLVANYAGFAKASIALDVLERVVK